MLPSSQSFSTQATKYLQPSNLPHQCNCHLVGMLTALLFYWDVISEHSLKPIITAKFYTVPKPVPSFNDGQKYCYCNEPECGQMLECSSGFCATRRFHMKCLKLKRVVKRWVCPCCRKIINKQKRDNRKNQK